MDQEKGESAGHGVEYFQDEHGYGVLLSRPANRSPCRAGRGLSPPGHPIATTASGQRQQWRYAPCLAHQKGADHIDLPFDTCGFD